MNLTKKTKKEFDFLSTRLAPRLILAMAGRTNRLAGSHHSPLISMDLISDEQRGPHKASHSDDMVSYYTILCVLWRLNLKSVII